MTIEEVTELRKKEYNKTLRRPFGFEDFTAQNDQLSWGERHELLQQICLLLQKKGTAQNFLLGSLINRLAIKCNSKVKSFKGMGTKKHPYEIEGVFGKGKIWNAHELFKTKKYPEFVKLDYCFSNCYTLAFNMAHINKPSKVLSGIFGNHGYSILHSVLEVEGEYILDFNLNLYMDKDLFFKLFPFEVLSELDGERIYNDKEFIEKNLELFKNKGIMYLNFAYVDCINYIIDKERQKQDIQFLH